MASTNQTAPTARSLLKLAIPVIPAWIALAGIMQSTNDGQSNVGVILGLAFVFFVVGLVLLLVFARSLVSPEKHALLPAEMVVVVITWLLAGVLAAAPAWVDDSFAGPMQGFALVTVVMSVSYFAKGIGLVDNPNNPFKRE